MLDEQLGQDPNTVLVAIDIDENEDVALVRDTWKERGYSGPVAIAPRELSEPLVAAFGPEVVTPPQAPVILISAEQDSARLLPSGMKSAEEIADELAKGR